MLDKIETESEVAVEMFKYCDKKTKSKNENGEVQGCPECEPEQQHISKEEEELQKQNDDFTVVNTMLLQ